MSAAPPVRTDARRVKSGGSPRLTREARREVLLEVAGALLVEGGFEAITMEGVAARAGVSKALPYTHFDNSDDVVVALYDRELGILTQMAADAMELADGFEPKVAAVVHAFFEALKARGEVLGALLRWAPDIQALIRDLPEPPSSPSHWLVADLFERELDLPKATARVVQRFFTSGLVGAMDSWLRKDAAQATVERIVVDMVVGGVQALDGKRPRRR
jgi:AcrR family transcriptional regulator